MQAEGQLMAAKQASWILCTFLHTVHAVTRTIFPPMQGLGSFTVHYEESGRPAAGCVSSPRHGGMSLSRMGRPCMSSLPMDGRKKSACMEGWKRDTLCACRLQPPAAQRALLQAGRPHRDLWHSQSLLSTCLAHPAPALHPKLSHQKKTFFHLFVFQVSTWLTAGTASGSWQTT